MTVFLLPPLIALHDPLARSVKPFKVGVLAILLHASSLVCLQAADCIAPGSSVRLASPVEQAHTRGRHFASFLKWQCSAHRGP